MNTEEAIYLIIQQYKQSPFDNDARFMAYLHDLIPEQKKDIRRIQVAFDVGAFKLLKKHFNNHELALCATKQLLIDVDIEECAADYTVSLLSMMLSAQKSNSESELKYSPRVDIS